MCADLLNHLIVFAPWCGHCKALAPEYEEAATTLKEKNIALAKIDCTEEADLCKEHGVEGYPTLKIFRGPDSVQPYSGQRKAQAIVSYMTKQAMPAVSDVDKTTLDEFKSADKVVLVAYFAADDKASNETFSTVASSLRDNYLFGATSDASLAAAEGVKQPAIVLYKSFDEGKNTFEEKFDKDAIATFAKTASIPLIGEVGPETYQGYMDVSTRHICHHAIMQKHRQTDSSISFRLASLLHTFSPRRPMSASRSPTLSRLSLKSTRARSTLLPLTPRPSVNTHKT